MAVSQDSKLAKVEPAVEGYITGSKGDEMHVVTISQEPTQVHFAGDLKHVDDTEKMEQSDGFLAKWKRQSFATGFGMPALAIAIVCVALGLVGFCMSVAIGIQSAVSSHAMETTTTIVTLPTALGVHHETRGAISDPSSVVSVRLDASATPFAVNQKIVRGIDTVAAVMNAARSAESTSCSDSESSISTYWPSCNGTTCATLSTTTMTSSATVTVTVATVTTTPSPVSSASDDDDFTTTETVTTAGQTSTEVVTASNTASAGTSLTLSTFVTEATTSSSISSIFAESTVAGVSGSSSSSMSSESTSSECEGGERTVSVTYTVVPATSPTISGTSAATTSITVTMTSLTTSVIEMTVTISATSSTTTSPSLSLTTSQLSTELTTVSSTATHFVTVETTQGLTATVTTTIVFSETNSITLPSPYATPSVATAGGSSLTSITQTSIVTVSVEGSISMEEASSTSAVHTPIGQSSSSALATLWNSTMVTTVGPTASGHGANITLGGSISPTSHTTAVSSVPFSEGSKVIRVAGEGWGVALLVPILAVCLLFT